MMKLSVITPVYNVEKYLSKCLDSILAQGIPTEEFEIIIVNDGSTDSSLKIAEKYQSLHTNIVVLSQENQGISVARNAGMDIAKGDYVYYIDPDDFLLRNSLNHLLDLAYEYDADMVTFKTSSIREGVNDDFTDVEYNFDSCSVQCTSGLEADEKGLYPLLLNAWFYIMKRQFILSTGLRYIPEMRNSEDTPFSLSVALNAQRVVITNANIHRYLERSDSIRQGKSNEKNFKKIEYDIKNVLYQNEINRQWKLRRSEYGYKRTQSFQFILILFSIVRMLRINLSTKYIKQRLELLKDNDLYPIGEISPEYGYRSVKFKMLRWCCNQKWLVLMASRLFGVKKRYEGCSI